MKKARRIASLFLVFLIVAASIANAASITVYVTNTGEKYHRGTCRYLRQSKIAISLDDAIKFGYEPCKVCKPPQ